MSQKIKVIRGYNHDVEGWEKRVNEFCSENQVFATQTHVVVDEGSVMYVAVCFYR